MNEILIIGAGSIGALIGAALLKGNCQIVFAGKPFSSYTQRLKDRGLQIYYPTGKTLWISPLHPQVQYTDTATYLNRKFKTIIIALKSNNLIEVIPYIKAHSSSETILIHAQNGIPYWWFNCDLYLNSLKQNIGDRFKERRYLETIDSNGILYRQLNKYTSVACVVKAPCYKDREARIYLKKAPRLTLGFTKNNATKQQQLELNKLITLFNQQEIKTQSSNKIRTAVCHKLAINIVTNVLSALTGKVIAELIENNTTNSLIKTAIFEINHLFTAYGIANNDLPTETSIYSYINTPGSQSHLPSLAQDFAQHKTGEVSLITAAIEMAEIAGIKIPTLFSLS